VPNLHIIEAQQFNKKELQEILEAADHIQERTERKLPLDLLRGKILGNLFYVKSMRTRLAFDVAMKRLGGAVTNIECPENFSSELAGGSFEDTVRVVGSLVDGIVLRHYRSGSAKRAAEVSPVPVINGGDGPAQHPTQALIDLYCIEKLKGGIDGVSIAFVGDLMNSRTVRSLAYFLAKYSGIKIHFVSPRALKMKDDMKDYLREYRVPFSESVDSAEEWREIASRVDILYVTQTPRDRFADRVEEYERSTEIFRVTPDILKNLKRDTYIMHPFPRDRELPPDIDPDPRAVYFDLLRYGQYLRMGLLCLVLKAQLA
jgi:aspartate carbamoyltransferase catalytic subunit